MEFVQEGIILGIDCLILGICVKEYCKYKRNINYLKESPQLPIDGTLKDFVAKQPDKRVPYAIIRGSVSPIGVPMRSAMSVTSVTGVVQTVKVSEHHMSRGFAGLWTDVSKLIHASSNEMPFELSNGDYGVHVIDALSADLLDMDVVYDNYEPFPLSFMDRLFGVFSGVHSKGFQTTEEMLRCGSFMTVVGELELDGDALRIQRSPIGPFLVSTATKSTLIKKFEEVKSSYLLKILIFGTVSVILFGIMGRKFYMKKKQERDERKIRERLEKERQRRRVHSRPKNIPDDQLCVVCNTNPKEIIILPCGHVCICEDCSEKIKVTCPVCRAAITSRAAAFIV